MKYDNVIMLYPYFMGTFEKENCVDACNVEMTRRRNYSYIQTLFDRETRKFYEDDERSSKISFQWMLVTVAVVEVSEIASIIKRFAVRYSYRNKKKASRLCAQQFKLLELVATTTKTLSLLVLKLTSFMQIVAK